MRWAKSEAGLVNLTLPVQVSSRKAKLLILNIYEHSSLLLKARG
jgi:hypothetical protein